MLSRLKLDPFVPALLITVLLALAWPQPGVSGGVLHADKAASYGIGFIFFLYGLTLAPERLIESAARWQAHLVVQLGTFVIFPLVTLALLPVMGLVLPEEVLTGFFFLAALPSTVSSSVAMTSLARGDVPIAIFNASLSSLIGVFLTPALMALYLHAAGIDFPLQAVIIKLILLVLLPLGLGQMVRPLLRRAVARHRGIIKIADRAVILAIVYNSFCDSVAEGVWQAHGATLVLDMVASALVLFALVYLIVAVICRLAKFGREARIAVLFCASKKSLATGLPMAKVMFGADPNLSLIIAPIMLFHFLQLVVVSFIASHEQARFAAEEARQEAEKAQAKATRIGHTEQPPGVAANASHGVREDTPQTLLKEAGGRARGA